MIQSITQTECSGSVQRQEIEPLGLPRWALLDGQSMLEGLACWFYRRRVPPILLDLECIA